MAYDNAFEQGRHGTKGQAMSTAADASPSFLTKWERVIKETPVREKSDAASPPSGLVGRLRTATDPKCPFDSKGCKLKPEEPCPVCGDLGEFTDEIKPIACTSFSHRKLMDDAAAEIERLNAALTEQTELARKSIRRLAELAEPGAIGAFASRDHWKEKALAAESALRSIRATTLDEADKLIGALWVDLFDKDLVKSEGADVFDKWRERLRDLATTEGGK